MHHYTISYPEVREARAKNKCRNCGRSIIKGERYVFMRLFDQCGHGRGFKLHLNYDVKLCEDCMISYSFEKYIKGSILQIQRNFGEKLKLVMRDILGVNRYDILKKVDPVERYIIRHKNLVGEVK